jgi:hypothetical protein
MSRLRWLADGVHWLGIRVDVLATLIVSMSAMPLCAQVNATVNTNSTIAVMPEYFMGAHASVYDNSLQYTGSPVFNQLDGLLDAAGVNVLRYPGGGYADVFHFSVSRSNGGITGYGLSPWWGGASNYGYMGPETDFGNFVKLLDGTNSKTVITVNTGSAIKYTSASSAQMAVPTHNGQPQEAAAWVAYANTDASLYGTPQDIPLGVDAEGNNWKTAGYWAKLRASTSAEYSAWATADGVYDTRNAFLAIDRDAPVGIKYWEIGNETFGTGYYGAGVGATGYALNYAAPRTGVNTPIGDYSWSYADLNDNGIKESNEPYWNDEVLSHTDGYGKVADNANFVIAHWYPNGTSNSIVNEPRITIPVMINGTTASLDNGSNAGLRDSIARWRSDGNSNAAEIFITETDGYGGSVEASDGLFAADEYATFLDNGVSNVDWLELYGGSFLNDSNTPNFAYWGIQSVHKLAEPGDELVSTTTSESHVRIHASRRNDGSVAVMILNMNTSSRTLNVSINGATLSEDGVRYQTDGDTALSSIIFNNLGNSFTTSIAARTLQVFVIPGLPGDYNRDGVVDAADYVVWRKNEGTMNALPNDPRGGMIGAAQFTTWRANFGNMAGSGSDVSDRSSSAALPEPTTLVTLLVGMLVISIRRRAIVS